MAPFIVKPRKEHAKRNIGPGDSVTVIGNESALLHLIDVHWLGRASMVPLTRRCGSNEATV